MVHGLHLLDQCILRAHLHHEEGANFESVLQLVHREFKVVLGLAVEAEHQRIIVLRVRKQANLVIKPEELDRALDIAGQLVEHLIVGPLLLFLLETGVELNQGNQQRTLWDLLSLVLRHAVREWFFNNSCFHGGGKLTVSCFYGTCVATI